MVDGVKCGEIIDGVIGDEGNEIPEAQDFQDADMVVIESEPSASAKELDNKTIFYCHAIYGNTIVSSTISRDNIKGINKIYVWAHKKPYILNGDLSDENKYI